MQLGIDQLTVLGMGPLEHIRLAAALGCQGVSFTLGQRLANPAGYPAWSLKDDAALRRAVRDELAACGIALWLGEGIVVMPGVEAASRGAEMDAFAEIGARGIVSSMMDCAFDWARDQFATLCDMATARGLSYAVEFSPAKPLRDLQTALALCDWIGAGRCGVVVDAMHHFRGGGTVAEVATMDPARLAHVQLCDVPLAGAGDYMEEAMYRRLMPGNGELPLAALLTALPSGVTLGLEVPLLARIEAGEDHAGLIADMVSRARGLMP